MSDHVTVTSSKVNNSISCIMEDERECTQDMERGLGDTTAADNCDKNITDGDGSVLIKVGSSRVLSKDVEKVILSAIILLKHDCDVEAPSVKTYSHTSVCAMTETVEIPQVVSGQHTPFCNSVWGALDFYQWKLSHIIEDGTRCTDDCLIGILCKIADAVRHMHERDRPHGMLSVEYISVSWDKRKHPFICSPDSASAAEHASKAGDIQDLGKLFYFVLTNGKEFSGTVNSDHLLQSEEETYRTSREIAETVASLILQMVRSEPIEIEEVLQHPTFWTDEKKVNFITELYDSISHDRKSIRHLEEEASRYVFDGNWVELLELNCFEKEELTVSHNIGKPCLDAISHKAGGSGTTLKKNVEPTVFVSDGNKLTKLQPTEPKKMKKLLKKVQDNKENIDSGVIHRLAENKFKDIKPDQYQVIGEFVLVLKEKDGGYQKDSLYDLLRFIRNRKAHIWENSTFPERVYYKAAGGFWTFYSKRFPKLLTFVYDNKTSFPYYTG